MRPIGRRRHDQGPAIRNLGGVGPGTSLCGGSTEKLAASRSTSSNSPLAQRATDGLLRRRRDRRDAPRYYGPASRAGTVGRCARGALGRPRLVLRAQALRCNLRPRPAVGTLAGGTASAHRGLYRYCNARKLVAATCSRGLGLPTLSYGIPCAYYRVLRGALAALPQCQRY